MGARCCGREKLQRLCFLFGMSRGFKEMFAAVTSRDSQGRIAVLEVRFAKISCLDNSQVVMLGQIE